LLPNSTKRKYDVNRGIKNSAAAEKKTLKPEKEKLENQREESTSLKPFRLVTCHPIPQTRKTGKKQALMHPLKESTVSSTYQGVLRSVETSPLPEELGRMIKEGGRGNAWFRKCYSRRITVWAEICETAEETASAA